MAPDRPPPPSRSSAQPHPAAARRPAAVFQSGGWSANRTPGKICPLDPAGDYNSRIAVQKSCLACGSRCNCQICRSVGAAIVTTPPTARNSHEFIGKAHGDDHSKHGHRRVPFRFLSGLSQVTCRPGCARLCPLPTTNPGGAVMKRLLLAAGVLVLAVIVIGIALLGFWPVPPDVPQTGAGGKAGAQVAPTTPDVRGTGKTLVVNAGQSIQAVVDKAAPGDIVQVMPGTYHESVLVQTPSLTLQGLVQGDQRPILDGQGQLANGVLSIANFFTISGFRIVNYTSNGATVQGITGPIFRDLITDKTGEYGIFPILSSDVLVDHCVTSRRIDTGIYFG